MPPVPFPEVHLCELRFDSRYKAEPCRKRCRRLRGPAQACDIDGVNTRHRQTLGYEHGLSPAKHGKWRISSPVYKRKRVGGVSSRRLAMSHEQHLGRLDGGLETDLTIELAVPANILVRAHRGPSLGVPEHPRGMFIWQTGQLARNTVRQPIPASG